MTLKLQSLWLVAITPVLLLGGCAAYSPSLTKAESPAADSAYLYGRFSIEAPKSFLSWGSHQSMGFSLDCASGQKLIIKFRVDEPVQLLRVSPASTCTFKEIVYTDADGFIKSRKPAPSSLAKEIEFTAGKASYLGDFFAATANSTSGNMIYSHWEIRRALDDYESTTAELKKAYPAFTTFPTEKKLIGR